MKPRKSVLTCRKGNFAITGSIAIMAMFGAVGLALTYTSALLQKTEMQNMLDASVLAGTALGNSATEKKRLATAYAVAGDDPLLFGSNADIDISIRSDGTRFLTNGASVIGTSTTHMPIPMAGLIGQDFLTITVTAKAEKRSSDPVCILALNPTDADSIKIFGNATLRAPNCAAMANSTSKEAIRQYGGKSLARTLITGVTGSYSGANIEPKPIADVEPMDDPYIDVPLPKPGDCMNVAAKLSKKAFVLEPGTYCGGISISPGASVSLKPGIYIIKDGQLSIGAGSTLTGQDVLLAFIGSDSFLYSNSNSVIDLTSPRSGFYKNIQFMSDRELGASRKGGEQATLSSSTLTYDGVMYLPEQDIWIKGGSQIFAKSASMVMVADQFSIQGTSDVFVSHENSSGRQLDGQDLGFKYAARLSK